MIQKSKFITEMASAGDVDWAGAADAQERNLVNRVGELNVTNEEGERHIIVTTWLRS